MKARVYMNILMTELLRVVNFATSKNLRVNSTMFSHLKIHGHPVTSLAKMICNEITSR
jgi:hypothetical protein